MDIGSEDKCITGKPIDRWYGVHQKETKAINFGDCSRYIRGRACNNSEWDHFSFFYSWTACLSFVFSTWQPLKIYYHHRFWNFCLQVERYVQGYEIRHYKGKWDELIFGASWYLLCVRTRFFLSVPNRCFWTRQLNASIESPTLCFKWWPSDD